MFNNYSLHITRVQLGNLAAGMYTQNKTLFMEYIMKVQACGKSVLEEMLAYLDELWCQPSGPNTCCIAELGAIVLPSDTH